MKASSRSWTIGVFGTFAVAILVAIWGLPGFLVQDGPLYLYNTHLMLELAKPSSPFHQYLTFDPRPLPYWGAYALLGGLMPVLPPRVADQVLMTSTSLGVATALLWLRWRITGWRQGAVIGSLAVVLCVNVLWMYGLHSFLLGAILYFATLGYWWRNRERMGIRQAALLSGLLIAGYFCHLVSFGLSALGVVILALFTPGTGFRRRLGLTALCLLPTMPLLYGYARLMGSAGDSAMRWRGITDFLSPREWLSYVFQADFPTIHEQGMSGVGGPFLQLLFDLPPPSRWALIGLCLLVGGSVLRRSEEDTAFYRLHRGWIALAVILLVGGALGPSDLGAAHGFLRERVLLLGCATLLPVLRLNLTHLLARAGVGLVSLAAIFQVCLLWDYAVKSDRLVGEFLRARAHIGTGKRLVAVIVDGTEHYRTSPLVHLPDMLGLGTGNLIWNNSGPALYYFPIKYRSAEARVTSQDVVNATLYAGSPWSGNRAGARDVYRTTMSQHHEAVDVLVLWSSTPEVDAINAEWFATEPLYEHGRLKVLRRVER